MLTLFSFLVFLVLFFFELIKNGFKLSLKPSLLFLLCWQFLFLFLPVVKFVDVYSHFVLDYSLVLFVCSVSLSFAIGASIADLIHNGRVGSVRYSFISFPAIYLIAFLSLLSLVGVIKNLSNVYLAGGLSLYSQEGARSAELTFGSNTLINYLYFLHGIILPLCLLKYNVSRKKIYAVLSCISFVSLFFHGTKSTIFYPVLVTSLSFVLSSSNIKAKYYFFVVVLLFLSFQFVTIMRNLPFIDFNELSLFQLVFFKAEHIFAYLFNGFVNLQQEIIHHRNFTFGAESFQIFGEILKFIGGEKYGVIHADLETPFNLYNISYNTGSFAREYYRDFGYIGTFLLVLFIGFIMQTFYYRLNYEKVTHIIIYSIISVMLIMAPFSNQFLRVQFWFWIFVLFLLSTSSNVRYRL